MKNCLVIGSGRSGTSMVAGTMSSAGYFMGEDLTPGDAGNPKGYFESGELALLNESILNNVLYSRRLTRWMMHVGLRERLRFPRFNQQLHTWHKWLAMLPIDRTPYVQADQIAKIKDFVSREPFCYKSPIFCYTLPAWLPYLKNTVFVCVFREPQRTAASMLKEAQWKEYLTDIKITFEEGLEIWTLQYQHILKKHQHEGDWLFLHYDQMFTPDGLDRLEAFVETEVDRSFPETRLSRTQSSEPIPERTALLYEQLCTLAGYIP